MQPRLALLALALLALAPLGAQAACTAGGVWPGAGQQRGLPLQAPGRGAGRGGAAGGPRLPWATSGSDGSGSSCIFPRFSLAHCTRAVRG